MIVRRGVSLLLASALFLAAVLIALPAHGARLDLRATAPTADNMDTSCTAPVLVSRLATDSLVVHFAWLGAVGGEDSVRVLPGALATLSRLVPSGLYTVRCWASDRGGAGCDTTTVLRAKGFPWKPRF